VGVLKVLEEEGILPGAIAGTSAGAVFGALYATTLDAAVVERRLRTYLEREDLYQSFVDAAMPLFEPSHESGFLDRFSSLLKKQVALTHTLSQPALISRELFRENLACLLDDIAMEETRIPFATVATDLEMGEAVVLREGSLLDAVYASCSYPGLVEPARLEGRLLVDGGASSIVPVGAARGLGGRAVVAVNALPHVENRLPERLTALDVLYRAEDVLSHILAATQAGEAEVVIHPGSGKDEAVAWYDVRELPRFIPAGEEATRRQLDSIRALLQPAPVPAA
jgi:NTE family protein